jgi:hypothetical protein
MTIGSINLDFIGMGTSRNERQRVEIRCLAICVENRHAD